MRIAAAMTFSVLGWVAMPPALAQGPMPTYEASQRLRTAADTCLKDEETMSGAYCVKNCQADFKLDLKARPPLCVGTKPTARYVPPKAWQPSDKPKAKPVPGA